MWKGHLKALCTLKETSLVVHIERMSIKLCSIGTLAFHWSTLSAAWKRPANKETCSLFTLNLHFLHANNFNLQKS